jgi:hypothetical protein
MAVNRGGQRIDFYSRFWWTISMALLVPHDSLNAGSVLPTPRRARLFRVFLAPFARIVLIALLLGLWDCRVVLSAESNLPPPTASSTEQTNTHEAVAAYLQLQEQLHATQLAVEHSLQETRAAVTQNAEAWSNGLQSVQAAFAVQRTKDLEAVRRSNKMMLMMAATLGSIGFLFLLLVAYFQWCMSRGLAELSAALPKALGWIPSTGLEQLGPAEQTSLPLLGLPEARESQHHESPHHASAASKPRRGFRRSIERRLFPRGGDSLRRRQFRSLKMAVLFGLIIAAAMAGVLYIMYQAPKS